MQPVIQRRGMLVVLELQSGVHYIWDVFNNIETRLNITDLHCLLIYRLIGSLIDGSSQILGILKNKPGLLWNFSTKSF